MKGHIWAEGSRTRCRSAVFYLGSEESAEQPHYQHHSRGQKHPRQTLHLVPLVLPIFTLVTSNDLEVIKKPGDLTAITHRRLQPSPLQYLTTCHFLAKRARRANQPQKRPDYPRPAEPTKGPPTKRSTQWRTSTYSKMFLERKSNTILTLTSLSPPRHDLAWLLTRASGV